MPARVAKCALSCWIADAGIAAAELRLPGAGRVRRAGLCQSVEHLAEVFINPEMPLAVTHSEPRAGQIR